MDKGVGYIVMGKGSPLPFNPTNITPQSGYTVNFTSQKVNNGLVDVVLYRDQYNIINGVSDSYNINLNLVGNPYPSAISTVELYNDNSSNIEPKFYFWTHEHPISNTFVGPWGYNFSNNSMYSATVSGSTVTTVNPLGNNPLGLNYTYIASGQAFFVQARNGITSGTTQLNFNNSMRNVTNPNISFLKTNTDDSLNRIWLSMTEINGDKNFIALGFGANNTDDLSLNDVYRMDSGNDTEFYSLIPQVQGDFDIQFLSEFSDDKTIPLGMEIRAAGSYAIQIEQAEGVFIAGQKIYLEDTYLDIIHEMGMGPYTFTQAVGENINDRFILRFTNSALGNEDTLFNQVKVYPNPSTGVFNISYQGSATLQYTVYDLTGKTILSGTGNQIDLSRQAIGMYFAKITDGSAVRSLKLVRE
ncbi:MAG: T9SS type A sorting domain-containing protein [Flavobacteriaceae bacterium]|nr:T9SS type A sorting domain-containing protein [Flavobacteriaceae bacterium]